MRAVQDGDGQGDSLYGGKYEVRSFAGSRRFTSSRHVTSRHTRLSR